MSDYKKIIPIVNTILTKYNMCNYCLGRFFSKSLHLSSNKILGKKLQLSDSQGRCYICKDLFAGMDSFLELMLCASLDYQYASFSVGTTIKPSIIDRDDYIRSQYKLKGVDSIKTDITKELAKLFSKKTKKPIDHLDPDITMTLNLKDESCQIRSKSITVSGRYIKTRRGFPQKQKPCDNCRGRGCKTCNLHGIIRFDSVEGVISRFIFEHFGSHTAKFTWIGGEDDSSLVLGSGRPFFAKIKNPSKRDMTSVPEIRFNSVTIHNLRLVPKSPTTPLRFNSVMRVNVSAASEVIDSQTLRKLKNLSKEPMTFYDKSGKRHERTVFSLKYRKNSKNTFTLLVHVQGGLPIKRFVTGDDFAFGVSQILGIACTCTRFDILDIVVQ